MRNVSKMLCHPFVIVDRIEITLASIGKYHDARRTSGNVALDSRQRRNHSTRRTAREDRFSFHQSTTSDHTVEVTDAHKPVGEVWNIKLRHDPASVSGYQACRFAPTENHAADGVYRDHLCAEPSVSQVLRASSQSAAGARRAKQVVEVVIQIG